MPALIRLPSAQWRRQPTGRVQIDWSDALTRGLVLCVSAHECAGAVPTSLGLGLTSASAFRSLIPAVRVGIANSTVLVLEYYGSLPNWDTAGIVYRDTSAVWPNDLGLSMLSAKNYGQINLSARNTAGTLKSVSLDVTPGNLAVGSVFFRCATVGADLLATAYDTNGKNPQTSTALQGFSYAAPTTGTVQIGPDAVAGHNGTAVLLTVRWSRALSAVEVAELAVNPWQLFAPDPDVLFFIPRGAASGTTLAISDSVHAHTATAISLTQAQQIAVQNALHGQTASTISLQQALSLILGNSTHTHTATALSLTQAQQIAVQNALHGQAVTAVTLTLGAGLAISNALHSSSASTISLILDSVTVLVSNALHNHFCSAVITPDDLNLSNRGFLVIREDRAFLIFNEDRLFGVMQ